MNDPGVFGDFTEGPDCRVRRSGRCPNCGAAVEWYDVTSNEGAGTPERWEWAAAECECGLRMEYAPNQPHLRAGRRGAAAARWEAEQGREQIELIGG